MLNAAAIDRAMIVGGRIVLGVVLLAAWELYPYLFDINPFWFSQPSLVLAKAVELHAEGTLLASVGMTVLETVLGLGLGCVIGVGIGMLLGLVRAFREIFEPFLLVANAFPKIAMAPLFMIWFGIGITMKIAIAFSLVVVVMALSTYSGMRTVRQELVNHARVCGANEVQIFGKIVLPSVAPWLFAGFKVSVTFALIGAVLGEFIAAQDGIGYMIDAGMANFDSSSVFLGLTLLLVLVWVVNATTEWVGHRFGIHEDSPTTGYNS